VPVIELVLTRMVSETALVITEIVPGKYEY